jgi:hypothetical protein
VEIISDNVDARLLDEARSLQHDARGVYAIHFRLFALQEVYQNEFQQRIAVNILNDVFRKEIGYIFKCRDGDLFVIYKGQNKNLLRKADKSVRYLFEDDPLAYHGNGDINENFSHAYDILLEWRPFYRLCSERSEFANQVEAKPQIIDNTEEGVMSPLRLAEILQKIDELDFNLAIRKQPICAIKPDTDGARVVYHEMYVNIAHLGRLVDFPEGLAQNKWLFGYLTEALDKHMLDMISDRPKAYISRPISLNINVSTIFTKEFEAFCDILHMVMKAPIVVELQVSEVFDDINRFLAAKSIIEKRGYRLCLDGLNTKSFMQIDREGLGFDLAKVRWNADLASDLDLPDNKRLASLVEKCGANRIILCRCDTEHAIDYGHALGISLFQGRYPDKVVNPNGRIEN